MVDSGTPHTDHHQSFWLWVMCLTGVDYFSTLGYQPSIAFEAAGLLAPIATFFLVLLTLFGALPMYSYVAAQSPHGQGSIAMLERLMHGWNGKLIVLILLGFAATDFVITKTLSAADAAAHLLANPAWQIMPAAVTGMPLHYQQVIVTMILLVVLGASFMRGFREVITVAVVLVIIYLVLNAIVIGCSLAYLVEHSDRLLGANGWLGSVQSGHWHLSHNPLDSHGHDWLTIVLLCLLLFPKLALGLSGFETGVAVMPLIKGREDDNVERPLGRIRNARKMLATAALIMSVFLMGSAFVTATLIPPEALTTTKGLNAEKKVEETKGPAVDRALAYLAHGESPEKISPLFGEWFGTIYDISTILILWFAGASAMAGLLNLIPRYLPRYGMAPHWASAVRPLVALFTVINVAVTWIFGASVSAQGGAYATGVLVLLSSAGLACVIDQWNKLRSVTKGRFWRGIRLVGYGIVALVFFYTTTAVMIEKPDGLKIASFFIAAIIISSLTSRAARSTELRFTRFEFTDAQSRFLWDSIRDLQWEVLVPHRPGQRSLLDKEAAVREKHRLAPEVPVVFIEVELGDPSDFLQTPLMAIKEESGRFVISVTRCASIAHVIAALGLELAKVGKPPEIHFGWSNESPIAANLSFLLFGEGNIPWMVQYLIRKAEPDAAKRPQVIIG